MTVRKRGKVWWYDFGNHKYRGPIPEARTKYEAQQAEIKLKRNVFEGKYGKQFGAMSFAEFVGNPDAENGQFGEGTFLEWSKNNKRSWKHDRFRVRVLLEAFKHKTLGEISPVMIERFKNHRQHSFTKRATA
ncbi:MAG TPA: hypothetical protein VGO68_07290 [Pyrinomonadaceae bacterium]|nr:hypothetical protein [Pyrinomonadaceae bacterium]